MSYCPYTVDRHLVQQTTYEYDENGNVIMQQVIEHNTAEFVECKGSRCAAWRLSGCIYGKAQ